MEAFLPQCVHQLAEIFRAGIIRDAYHAVLVYYVAADSIGKAGCALVSLRLAQKLHHRPDEGLPVCFSHVVIDTHMSFSFPWFFVSHTIYLSDCLRKQ